MTTPAAVSADLGEPLPPPPPVSLAHPFGDMDLEEFKTGGHYLVSWLATAFGRQSEMRTTAPNGSETIRQRLPHFPPQAGSDLGSVLGDMGDLFQSGVFQSRHPRFFGHSASGHSGPAKLGAMLAAALDADSRSWRAAQGMQALEQVTMSWLGQMMGLADRSQAVNCGDPVSGNVHGLIFALTALAAESAGPVPSVGNTLRYRTYVSASAGPGVAQAVAALGLPPETTHVVASDRHHRLRSEALAKAIATDRAEGRTPLCVVATIGTPLLGGFDAIAEIARTCERERVWLHIDAAGGGAAAVVPEMRQALVGMERADSVLVGPQPWLFTPDAPAVIFCRRPRVFRRALEDATYGRILNGIRRSAESATHVLTLWFVIRYFGWDGLVSRVREQARLARLFASWVDAHPHFERVAPVLQSTVCFRARPDGVPERSLNDLNDALATQLQMEGEVCLEVGTVKGMRVASLTIANIGSEECHVRQAWALVRIALHCVHEASLR